jgi:small GTP-binding protein
MAIVNIGILAHVGAGKSTLTGPIVFETGVIPSVGSVDKGTTQTDTLELERARGITIKSAVVSFRLNELTVNLIDTPVHPDFVADNNHAVADGLDNLAQVALAQGDLSRMARLGKEILAIRRNLENPATLEGDGPG